MAATHKRGRGQRGYLPGTQCILCVLGARRDRHAAIALRSATIGNRLSDIRAARPRCVTCHVTQLVCLSVLSGWVVDILP